MSVTSNTIDFNSQMCAKNYLFILKSYEAYKIGKAVLNTVGIENKVIENKVTK